MHDHNSRIEFDDNRLANLLYGAQDCYLNQIAEKLNVRLNAVGNKVFIEGKRPQVTSTEVVLRHLFDKLRQGHPISRIEVTAALSMTQQDIASSNIDDFTDVSNITLATQRKMISPRTKGQTEYLKTLLTKDLVFGLGPAGTGKTYLAVAVAVSMLAKNQVSRLILSRPAVEAGEKLGFLPGAIRDKIDPYLRPLYDALHDMMPADLLRRRLENGEIEIAPLAFMRGRTLDQAYIILDEAQNTTQTQMKMFLTRLGHKSKMVVTGDVSQIDLPKENESGLIQAVRILQNVDQIGWGMLSKSDIVRHPLVSQIVDAYDTWC